MDIYKERKQLGEKLVNPILKAVDYDGNLSDTSILNSQIHTFNRCIDLSLIHI